MNRRLDLLHWEVANLQLWLDRFECAHPPRAGLAASGETLWVHDFPLPDQFRPDRVSLALLAQDFPLEPPKGIYLASTAGNKELLRALARHFNIFQNKAFHGAPAIQGFEWICVGYLEGWRHDARSPRRGDNIQKMLLEFWRLLEEA